MREYPVLDVHDPGRRHGCGNARLHEEQRPSPGSPVDAGAGQPKQQLGFEPAPVERTERVNRPAQSRGRFFCVQD